MSGCVPLIGNRVTPPPPQPAPESPPPDNQLVAAMPHADGPSPYNVTTSVVEPARTIDPPVPIRPLDSVVQPVAAPSTPSAAPPQPVQPPQTVMLTPVKQDPPLVESLRKLLENKPSEALTFLGQYDQNDQQLLLAMLALAARLADPARPSGAEAVELDNARRALAATLKPRAALSLGTVCFCNEVKAFGVYKPKLPAHDESCESSSAESIKTKAHEKDPRYLVSYEAGEPMKLYIEVRDFYSHPHDGCFETRLAATVDLLQNNNPVVPPINLAAFADRSLTPRQDYFIVLTIPVPSRLPQGTYTLWLTVRDETPPPPGAAASCRSARRSLDFCVGDAGMSRVSH
jgi:hypothetical protein